MLNGDNYICDGSRIDLHETNFQDYLEKYFMFRKAYCRLHIDYRWFVKPLVIMLSLISKPLARHDQKALIHKINAVLIMDKLKQKYVDR